MNHLELCRTVQDGIHGPVGFTSEEVAVIDHRIYQRLRYIYQTGVLYLITQSATHRRFEHSLGVVATAQALLDALHRGSRRSSSKLYPLATATRGQAVLFHEFPEGTQRLLQRVTRLCALAHDLGHGPLSHTFDAFAPKSQLLPELLMDPRLAGLRPFFNNVLHEDRLPHEVVSCLLFAAIWHDVGGEPWMPAAVACVLLEGHDPPKDSGIPEALHPLLPLITDIVSSAPVDADRMDYLLRDSRQLAVSYGLYEKDRLLKSVLCAADVRSPQDPESPLVYRIGWRQSGLGAVENFLIARSLMFREMYAHKTYRAFELMLKRVADIAREKGISLIDARSLDGFTDAYCRLTDDVFLRMLAGEIPSKIELLPEIHALAERVMLRQPWKRLYDVKRSMYGKESRILVELQALHPTVEFLIDKRPTRATKDLNRGSRLYDLNGEGKYSRTTEEGVTDGRSWLQESAIIEGLHRDEVERVRIFAKVSTSIPEERKRADALRADALRIAATLR